jgi:hypothetical protein
VHARAGLPVLLVLVAVAAGTWLRLEPARRAGRADPLGEAAFHGRMLHAEVEEGGVPAIDPLSLPPLGKPIRALLPTFLYDLVGSWHRALSRIRLSADPSVTAIGFTALCGGAIALPIFAAARLLGAGAGAAAIAAGFAVLSPAHLERTAGHVFGPDAPVALLLVTHMAALAGALAAGRGARLLLFAALAAATLILAMALGRMALVFVPIESLLVLGAFLIRRLRLPLLIALAPGLAAALAVSLVIPSLLTGPFLLGRAGALAFLTLGLLLLDAATALHAQRGRLALGLRIAIVAVILFVAAALGRAPAYDDLGAEILAKSGLFRVDRSIPSVPILIPGDPRTAAASGSEILAALPALALALLYAAGRLRKRPALTGSGLRRPLSEPNPARLLWHGATLLFVVLTLLFSRHGVITAPLLAVYPALLLDDAARSKSSRYIIGAGGVLLALVLSGIAGMKEIERQPTHVDPDVDATLVWLKTHARPGDVVAADWTRGDLIQARTGLATVSDGLTGLPEMRSRIAAFTGAMASGDERDPALFCRSWSARYLWVHRSTVGATDERPGLRPCFRAGSQQLFELLPATGAAP